MEPAIEISGLGKQYRLGEALRPTTLVESVALECSMSPSNRMGLTRTRPPAR